MKNIFLCLLSALGICSSCCRQGFENIDVNGFNELISQEDVVILDVRTAEEFADGHIADAINIDVNSDNFIEQAKILLPADKRIAVYCRSGRRSATAAQKLSKIGFKPTNLEGGILDWEQHNLPIVK